MKNKRLIINSLLLALIFIGLAGFSWGAFLFTKSYQKDRSLFNEEREETTPKPSPLKATEKKEAIIKEEAKITVPYTVQAPFRNWAVHEESCEEAAILMYRYFLLGKKVDVIPQKTAAAEMIKMKEWQKRNYGKEPDLTISALGKFAEDYYGYNAKVFKNVTITDIKREISKGNPVIVPVMTHSLKNPNYGPENTYHVLLIKGYNKKGVVTNDAGVSQGKNYFYSWEILFKAIDAQKSQLKQGRDLLVVS